MELSCKQSHRVNRTGWLRAAVLGANDGIISVASLMVGVAVTGASQGSILLTGVTGMVAGGMAMAVGEYVSVQSQADAQNADIETERRELELEPESELAELTLIYVRRGLEYELAHLVAEKLMATDALNVHIHDELGITETLRARPVQAAVTSAVSFCMGAFVPIIAVLLSPLTLIVLATSVTGLAGLIILGGTAAWAGGASVVRGAVRVSCGGVLAMALTACIGKLFGTGI